MKERSKTLNDLLAQLDRAYLSPHALAYPTRIFAAVSVVCDIRCPYCPRQHFGDEVDSRLMDIDEFRKLAPALSLANFVGLFGLGEPFLHKQFFEFLKVTKNAGAYAATSTHGMSLTPDVIDQTIDDGLDEIEISIDSPKRRTFEFLRAGADLKTVLHNARTLRSHKRTRRSEKPRLHIAVAVSRHNVKTLPALVRLARSLDAARIAFADLIVLDPNNKDLSVTGTPLMEKYLGKARRLAARIGQEMTYFPQNPFPWQTQDPATAGATTGGHFGCPEAWGVAVVDRDGGVKPCCYISDVMGNAFATPLDEIESGEGKTRLRDSLLRGDLPQSCRECRNLAQPTAQATAETLESVRKATRVADLEETERRFIERKLAEYRNLFARREYANTKRDNEEQ